MTVCTKNHQMISSPNCVKKLLGTGFYMSKKLKW